MKTLKFDMVAKAYLRADLVGVNKGFAPDREAARMDRSLLRLASHISLYARDEFKLPSAMRRPSLASDKAFTIYPG